MTELTPFDFDGLDQSAVALHAEHGPCVHSETFIRWLGWTNPAHVRKDHLRPGDEVQIRTSTKRGSGTTQRNVRHLTKRGVRRLLFRSNNPRAVEYADMVLDLLDELDRAGMVVDEQRITDQQIETGKQRLDSIAQRRLEEKQDYRAILHALKLGGAVADEYQFVQNTLYLSLLGKTASDIRNTQPQRTGIPRTRGEGFRKSTVAKDYLTEDQLALLNSTVLATVAQIQLRHPHGAKAAEMTDAIHRAISIIKPRSFA